MNISPASGIRRSASGSLGETDCTLGSVNEDILISVQQSAQEPAPAPERLSLLTQSSVFLSEILDSFSFLFFCLPFSSLTHLVSSWCQPFNS